MAATTGADAGQSASNTITPQLGALPRVERSMSMSFFLATPLNHDTWTRTHREGQMEQPDVGCTVPWLTLNSLSGGQPRVMIDNCAGASVFLRGITMCNLSGSPPLRRQKPSKRQLANAQPSHCMMAAACQFGTMRQT